MKRVWPIMNLLTARPCAMCGSRFRCWRWHIEFETCPTCGTTVDEFDPRAGRIASAHFNTPRIEIKSEPPRTWGSGLTEFRKGSTQAGEPRG